MFINMNPKDTFAQLGSLVGGLMFFWAIFQQYFPYQLRTYLEKYSHRLVNYVYPYIQVRFNDFTGERLMRSEAYSAIQNYLSVNSSMQAKRLKADIVKKGQSLVLSMDDHEEVADVFKGVKLWWASGKNTPKTQSVSFFPTSDERRYYRLTFHKRHRDLIIGPYLKHVLKEGKAIKVRNRQRKLYTNNGAYWSHVVFEHPATFQTLAMEPEKKKEIIDDLIAFSQAEDFYARIGRAWKRGYLLYGPPGTGKSTMIAAMANLLNYDIYDLELTAVKDNTELRRLLIETSSKSIIVIEDIDCSLELTGQRKKEKKKEKKEDQDQEGKDQNKEKPSKEDRDGKGSQVTLSGLLNFIDGLWSACGGERLIVFTTNYKEKLDPALIRKGRMDKHIELSYCGFEAFKVLAKNYLQVEEHSLFPTISNLLGDTKITPADVAEHLMPKTIFGDAEISLNSLVKGLENAKEEEEKKAAEEEAAKKKELLDKKKAEEEEGKKTAEEETKKKELLEKEKSQG
ncbi:putative mitochondrial chaperone BCS1-B [Morus notabilis]|uniref:Putative mitochondrial chaperone BCS1-B n=1 Tax=Morus notabilis TaxID=981085 RepID=W9QX89_9ROSA|nr:putative mitochondrial chaperone BCS1-B [Morus notabilis]